MKTRQLKGISGQVTETLDWPDIEAKSQHEGQVDFQVAASKSIYDAPAFFNPVMVLNRDLAILFGKTYAKEMEVKLRVFEPLAGIGVRAFRLAKEIPDSINEVVIADFNPVTTAIANVNNTQLELNDKVLQFKREARSLAMDLAEQRFKYHYIDLDPFGSPSPFIDSMWNLLTYRSLIAVTATDMTVLCGVYPEACMRKYGGYPLNNHHTHETATRLLIAMVVQSAARFERGIVPIFSINVDHYTKVFFQVRTSRGDANDATGKIGFSYTCDSCQQIYYTGMLDAAPVCCGSLHKAGPLWTGNLFDREWAEKANSELATLDLPSQRRIAKLLAEARDTGEIKGFYQISEFCKNLTLPQPSFDDLFSAIEKAGYEVVRSQFTDQAIRSDISGKELQKIITELVSANT